MNLIEEHRRALSFDDMRRRDIHAMRWMIGSIILATVIVLAGAVLLAGGM